MTISVIIATLHRDNDLEVLFKSFLTQSLMPSEIIVVDQSDDERTKNLCQNYKKNLPLKYFHCSVKSASYCRNYGVERSEGEIIAFLDDDTKLDPDYIKSVDAFYREHPQALGGMSRIINYGEFREKLLGKGFLYIMYKTIASIFGLNSFKKGFIVLPSSRNLDLYEAENTLEVQWLSTCNCWVKKTIFDEFRFEEKFKKWSFGEDRMWSYQIYKKYPGTLFFYPKAALFHFESSRNRMLEEDKIFMKVTYQFWFSWSCVEGNKFFYWWANTGEIVLHFLNAMIRREPFINSWYYIKANIKLLGHMKRIKKGDLNFIED